MRVQIVRLANGLVSFEVSDLALDQETDIKIVDHLTPDQAIDIAQRLLAAAEESC